MSDRQYGLPAGYTDSMPLERISSHGVSPIEAPRNLPWPSRPSDGGFDGGRRPYRDDDNSYGSHPGSSSSPSHYGGAMPTPPHEPSLYHPGQSQNSLAPLVRPQLADSRSIDRYSQGSLPRSGLGMADFESRMPRVTSYHNTDGYNDIDPWDIDDDGDDGLDERPRQRNSRFGSAAAVGAGAGAVGSAGAGIIKSFGSRAASGNYGPVAGGQAAEKSEWLRKQSSGSKRLKWIVGSGIALLVVAAIVGGVLGGVLGHHSQDGSGNAHGGGSSSSDDGDLYDLNSAQVKAVMDNANLHKVFPGMDYTPLNAQYPGCLTNPPDQNNVTLDVAIMSQLAPAIRLYGTDCNQTEMVLEAISRLDMNNSMKVWMGVYLDKNTTTNARQLSQMYDVLSKYPSSAFAGFIVGNEVLYNNYSSAADLETQLEDVRTNLTSQSIHLPVATADLGVAWSENPSLAQSSDIVMANVHPFFAGVVAADGANWAWSFWHSTDVPLTTATSNTISGTDTRYPTQIISEIGWPSEGGHDCGGDPAANYGCTSDDDGSVASIDNVNTFMDAWVCQAMANNTMYFWFEAFDQPWQAIFDTADDNWEPHWGLLDANRNLKDGVKIPDCGGKTIDATYLLPASSPSTEKRKLGRSSSRGRYPAGSRV